MSRRDIGDALEGNVLTRGLGPLLAYHQRIERLTSLPALPRGLSQMPPEVRLLQATAMRDFHIPSAEGARLLESVELMIRPSYARRDPMLASTWKELDGNISQFKAAIATPPMLAVVVGLSGVGKTQAIARALGALEAQVIRHASFPGIVGEHLQLVYLSVDAPATGKLVHLAETLMSRTDEALLSCPGYTPRFDHARKATSRNGLSMMLEWQQMARAHFLGILHVDEIQNLFKLQTLKKRRSHSAREAGEDRELRIVEDETLKSVLTFSNTWQIPLILSGTPDGIAALNKRFSTLQRGSSGGFHRIEAFKSADDPAFEVFMKQLGKYQYMSERLPMTDELRTLVHDLTGGIQRIIMALWFAAHRVATERQGQSLQPNDFLRASTTLLAPLKPAVDALKSGDLGRIRRYEDLLPGDPDFWQVVWGN